MNQPIDQQPTLATGAPLTADTWADFVRRLRHHCRGDGVKDHYTAYAVFTVQARRLVTGLHIDYAEHRLVYENDDPECQWTDPAAFWNDADEETRQAVNKTTASEWPSEDVEFTSLEPWQQWVVLEHMADYTVTGYYEEWENVGVHFTREAADAFIKRKAHDHPLGLRVYVDAQPYAWEFEAIKNAIMDGRLRFIEELES